MLDCKAAGFSYNMEEVRVEVRCELACQKLENKTVMLDILDVSGGLNILYNRFIR